MNFYKTKKWKNKRAKILRRDEYLCRECVRYRRTTPDGESVSASTVHHINPLEQHPEWRLQSWNLISLCSACHDAMHDRITGILTEKGMEWVDRSPPPSTKK